MSYSIGATPKGNISQPFAFENTQFRTLKIAHQRVQLDVNLSTHQIKGTTDIVLIPLVQNLDYITLDCKDIKIEDVWIENRRCDNYIHDNQANNLKQKYLNQNNDILFSDNSIEQSQFLREKFSDLTENPDDRRKSQLIIKVPSSIKITLQDANSLTNYTPVTPSIRGTPAGQETVFTPLTVRIEYEIKNPSSGIKFDTVLEDSPHLWNAYTTNAEFCSTASYWMPCINALDEKSTWEIEISVPRKVKDIGTTKMVGQKEETDNNILLQRMKKLERTKQREANNEEEDDEDEEDEDLLDEENQDNPLNRDIIVCCSEFSTVKEFAHPTDLSKKVYSFQIFNPVAPHHIGWAIGAFDSWELPSLLSRDEGIDEEQDENDELNGNTNYNNENNDLIEDYDTNDVTPIQVYTLPTDDIDEKMVLNSTIVCQRIIDFYSKEFGSYPFTSYSLIFLPTVVSKTMDFASLTICNSRLLYPANLIDPMFSTTDKLAWSLATQWSGVNITPLDVDDIWCCIGMAGYMVFQVIKKLYGTNELKYRLKLNNEAIVEQDWEMQPLGTFFDDFSRPICIRSGDLDFIKLKAPMVLYILDRRMTKTERSFGMSRVLPKIFLQAMSGELANNSLNAAHFQHICERVNKNKLESFFHQWVYGAGVPIFRVTQRFNKKRMVVEMGIRQCQAEELGEGKVIGPRGFVRSSLNHIENPYRNTEPFFTGSMTIRIHEPDGTPYEHIVEIKDTFTKIDIQYNTKYRKLRNRKSTSKSSANLSNLQDEFGDEKDDDIVKLGIVLDSKEESQRWDLTDVDKNTEGHELQAQNEAYEWIRIDSDFEWISKIIINQPDYMFASQLQQDVDIEAQIESIRYYDDVVSTSVHSSLVYSSILTRTIMDEKYFYGVRLEACRTLSKYIYKPETNFLGGSRHLIKIFRNMFCFDGSDVPKSNDFDGTARYLIQKRIVECLSYVRNEHGESPNFVKQFLMGLLKYNDNSNNFYMDHIYICVLIKAVVECTLHDKEDRKYLKSLLAQLDRYQNLDKWSDSYDFCITREVIRQKLRLNVRGLYDFNDLNEILESCLDDSEKLTSNIYRLREGLEDVALTSFGVMLVSGGIKNAEALKFFFEAVCFYPDIYVRENLVDIFVKAIDYVVCNKYIGKFDDDLDFVRESIIASNLNLENENEVLEFITADINNDIYSTVLDNKRKNIEGMIKAVRKLFKDYEPLKDILWNVLHTPQLSLYSRKRLFDIARVLYQLENKLEVVLPAPRMKKLVAKNIGEGRVVLKRDGIMKLHLKATKIEMPPNKLKITIPIKQKAKPKPKPKREKHIIQKVGVMPLRFVRLTEGYKRIDVSSVPFSERVVFSRVNARSFIVKIKYDKK